MYPHPEHHFDRTPHHPPPAAYPPPSPPQFSPGGQPVPVAMTQRAVAQQRMGYGTIAFHWFMMFMTCFLWTPVFLSARRKRRTVTVYR